jgi:hypothetical protein
MGIKHDLDISGMFFRPYRGKENDWLRSLVFVHSRSWFEEYMPFGLPLHYKWRCQDLKSWYGLDND